MCLEKPAAFRFVLVSMTKNVRELSTLTFLVGTSITTKYYRVKNITK